MKGGHIAGAYLQWNKEVAESTTQTCRQYKEYQNSTVHGYQCIVEFRSQFTSFAQ